MSGVLAFFGNISYSEVLFILVIAIMVFGRRLPEVAARGVHQLVKLRRSLAGMWRETGMAEEWRSLQRGVDSARRFDPFTAGNETWRGRRGASDQQPAPDAAELAARQAPEVPWGPREEPREVAGPLEIERPGSQPPDAAGSAFAGSRSAGREASSAPASEGSAGGPFGSPLGDTSPDERDPDFGAPEGSVPRT